MTFVELLLELILSVSFRISFLSFSCFSLTFQHLAPRFCRMGFCRRCGEIVSGSKCKCGGTAAGEQLRLGSSDGQSGG